MQTLHTDATAQASHAHTQMIHVDDADCAGREPMICTLNQGRQGTQCTKPASAVAERRGRHGEQQHQPSTLRKPIGARI